MAKFFVILQPNNYSTSMKIFTTEDIRAIDRATIAQEGISARELIERVADGVANEISSRWSPNKDTVVFAGPGNNGADALAVSRLLIGQGFNPEIFLFNIGGDKLSSDCRDCRDDLLKLDGVRFTEVTDSFNLPELASSSLVIDGLFGSGLREPLVGGFMTLVRYINESGAKVVSIDLPSGMFGDWNRDVINRNIIHATLTLSLQFPRLAFMMKENAELVGEWKVLDIGLSPEAIHSTKTDFQIVDTAGVKMLLKPRNKFCSKADFGNLMIVAGQYGMMGAAQMCAHGASRSGVGKLTVHTAGYGFDIIQSQVPEAFFEPDKSDTIVTEIRPVHAYSAFAAGPGLGTADQTINALDTFLRTQATVPMVLDADALNCISMRRTMLNNLPQRTILTPHAVEFDRLFGTHATDEERLLTAVKVAEDYDLLILLKGHYTALVRPDGKIYFNSTGTPALATPGSGDVLTGVIGSFLAQGYKPEIAPLLGAFIHGLAGEIAAEENGEYGVTAGDIAACIGKAIRRIMGR